MRVSFVSNGRNLIGVAAAVLMLGTMAARASEATLLGDRAGFLLGHAHRCGVADARLQPLEPVIGGAMAAFASDEDDNQAADNRFAERFLASALARFLGDLLPSCTVIRSQLARLEQHGTSKLAQSGSQGNRNMIRNSQSKHTAVPSRRAATSNRAKAPKQTTTRHEELSHERRAELELKWAAREMRGRPPSI
jgi:hypothetical protein